MDPRIDETLDTLRRTADPLADTAIAELFRTGRIQEVNRALDALDRNDTPIPPDLPEPLRTYLEESSRLPDDFSPERFLRAQRAFALHGTTMGVALMYASLPSLYAGAMGGVQLLTMTGQLQNHYRRRAAETLRFILDVMEPGGFSPRGQGVRAIQKVRLVHATIRFFARHGGRWAALPEWGEPLNQEELSGTLLAFSVVAIDNARRLGAPLEQEQIEDLLYAWGVVGHLLGIRPEAVARSLDEGRALWRLIGKRNFAPTPQGATLGADHVSFLDDLVPGQALDGINLALSRWLMGPYVANTCLALPKPPWWTRFLVWLRPLLGLADRFSESSRPVERLVEEIHLHLMESLQSWWADGRSLPFRIPTRIGPHGTNDPSTETRA